MTHFDKVKKDMYPGIKDWTGPRNKLRNTPGYKLSIGDWFWFNPWAYRYIRISTPLCFLIAGIILVSLCYFKTWRVFGVISIVIIIISAVSLVKALKQRPLWKETKMNFYDLYLREYPKGRLVEAIDNEKK